MPGKDPFLAGQMARAALADSSDVYRSVLHSPLMGRTFGSRRLAGSFGPSSVRREPITPLLRAYASIPSFPNSLETAHGACQFRK
jgi:hypothetical protein